ncbi:hypothetical protein SAMN04488117_108197 [Celeribacter baekdonensis]|uniref:Uncharacterized protein n=1 Tax=Celeribacter baekdonensis TaxID=875171 RepID=A0A1G7PXM7_9RHOB|nr:hypothetical protein SAMN04488117_108197 [Celeribacter baekdonensis]
MGFLSGGIVFASICARSISGRKSHLMQIKVFAIPLSYHIFERRGSRPQSDSWAPAFLPRTLLPIVRAVSCLLCVGRILYWRRRDAFLLRRLFFFQPAVRPGPSHSNGPDQRAVRHLASPIWTLAPAALESSP